MKTSEITTTYFPDPDLEFVISYWSNGSHFCFKVYIVSTWCLGDKEEYDKPLLQDSNHNDVSLEEIHKAVPDVSGDIRWSGYLRLDKTQEHIYGYTELQRNFRIMTKVFEIAKSSPAFEWPDLEEFPKEPS